MNSLVVNEFRYFQKKIGCVVKNIGTAEKIIIIFKFINVQFWFLFFFINKWLSFTANTSSEF